MKKQLLFAAMLGLSGSLVFTGCNNNPPEKKVEQAEQDMHETEAKAEREKVEARNDFEEEWLKYKNEQEERLKKNEEEIARYKDRSASMKKNERADYDARIANLEDQNRSLRSRINEYEKDTVQARKRDNWENFRKEFNHDMDELGNAFRNLGRDNTTTDKHKYK